jgi:hypothetical protein
MVDTTCIKVDKVERFGFNYQAQCLYIKGTWFPSGFNLCISDGVHAWTACPSEASITQTANTSKISNLEYIDRAHSLLGKPSYGVQFQFCRLEDEQVKLILFQSSSGAFLFNVILDAAALRDVIIEMLDFAMDSWRNLDERLGKEVRRYERLEIELKYEKLKVEDELDRVKTECLNLQKAIDDGKAPKECVVKAMEEQSPLIGNRRCFSINEPSSSKQASPQIRPYQALPCQELESKEANIYELDGEDIIDEGKNVTGSISNKSQNRLVKNSQGDTNHVLSSQSHSRRCDKATLPSSSPLTNAKKVRARNPISTKRRKKSGSEYLQATSGGSVDAQSSEGQREFKVQSCDFHDFDEHRTESEIKINQYWALYDDQDGMPRFYGRVCKIVRKPFQASIEWLEPFGAVLPATCFVKTSNLCVSNGEFRMSFVSVQNLPAFSHRVEIERTSRGIFKIYPREGEVWALYKAWDKKIGCKDAETKKVEYELVEVQNNFSAEQGLKVVPLLKVVGFRTLFNTGHDGLAYWIPAKNMAAQFSHRILEHRMLGCEARGVPSGSWELDPASTPASFLSSIPNTQAINEEHHIPNTEAINEELPIPNTQVINEELDSLQPNAECDCPQPEFSFSD